MKPTCSTPRRILRVVMFLGLGFAILAAQPVLAQAQKNPAKTKREWNWKTGQEIYQLITVQKRPSFKVQGLTFESKIHYKILSKLTMRISPFDGSLTIKQKVETTKLEEADDLSKAVLTRMLHDLTGKTITIRVNADGEVARIEGIPEPMAQAVGAGLDFRGAMLSSLIDRDGWKELTLATVFTPRTPLVEGAQWEEAISHGWGPLGSWSGQTAYKSEGRRQGLEVIAYAHTLKYQPPAMAAGQNALPFKIANPAFEVKSAQGTLKYDAGRGRLSSMEETFHVAGQMIIQIAGQNLPMQIEERQEFRLELFDKKPAAENR